MGISLYTKTPSQIWVFWGIPVYVLLCSQFFFVGSNTNILLVNSKPITSGITFAVPFYDDIVSIKTDQSVELWATATTKDKVFVRGVISVELDLDSNTSYWTSNEKIKQDSVNAIGESFRSVVSGTNAADLWNLIPLEAEIVKTTLDHTGTKWRTGSTVRIIKINVMTQF